jgi:hypothetical protein
MAESNRYSRIIHEIFTQRYQEGIAEILFERSDIVRAARKLRIKLPKNLGDVLYTFRYRADLPARITRKAPEGYEWIIPDSNRFCGF